MWPRVVFWLRLGAVAWVTLVGVVAALQASGTVPRLPKLEPWAWAFSLVILGIDNAGTLISRGVHKIARERNAELEKALMSLLIDVARSGGVRFEDLGASVFQPSRLDRLVRREPHQLVRTVRFRPSDYPLQSGIDWAPSKGAVGAAWSGRKEVYKNWRNIAERWGGVDDMSDDQFKRISASSRMNFSKKEFLAIAGKYSEVLVLPIWHRKKNRMIGVLSIDRAFKAEDATFTPELEKKGTREVAAATASLVGRILHPNGDKVE